MGKLVVLEGIDGSGKSAQYRRLVSRFEREDIKYHSIVFPRYDQESSALIRMYLGGQFGEKPEDVNAFAASIFYAVDRYASYMTDWKEYYEQGGLVDGDRLMALFAYHLQSQGKLHHDTFVATVMSNLGLFKFAESHHMHTRSAQVGDRYVLETMLKEDFWLGGEQSGHIIFREFMTTGDGQLSGLQLLGLMKGQGKSLSQLAGLMKVYPQTLVNIHSTPARMASFSQDERVRQAIHRANQQLGENGRVLVRPSGTEPLIRVMVEGPDLDQIQEIAQELVQVIEG